MPLTYQTEIEASQTVQDYKKQGINAYYKKDRGKFQVIVLPHESSISKDVPEFRVKPSSPEPTQNIWIPGLSNLSSRYTPQVKVSDETGKEIDNLNQQRLRSWEIKYAKSVENTNRIKLENAEAIRIIDSKINRLKEMQSKSENVDKSLFESQIKEAESQKNKLLQRQKDSEIESGKLKEEIDSGKYKLSKEQIQRFVTQKRTVEAARYTEREAEKSITKAKPQIVSSHTDMPAIATGEPDALIAQQDTQKPPIAQNTGSGLDRLKAPMFRNMSIKSKPQGITRTLSTQGQ